MPSVQSRQIAMTLFSASKIGSLVQLFRRLGTVAVHGIMAGFTDFSVGLVRDEPVMIPIDILVEAGSRKMKRKDYEWQRLLQATGQWNFLSPDNYAKVIAQEREEDLKRKD